jgi:hypothetical protein
VTDGKVQALATSDMEPAPVIKDPVPYGEALSRERLLTWLLVDPLAQPDAGPASVLIDELGAHCFQCSSDCQVGPASSSIAVLPSQIAAARRTFAVRTLLRPTLKKQRKNSGGDNSGKIFTA